MMKAILVATLGMLMVGALACNQPLTPPNDKMGYATRHARDAMIKNPDAAKEGELGTMGVSARTADGIVKNYKHNQQTQEQQKRQDNFGIQVNY